MDASETSPLLPDSTNDRPSIASRSCDSYEPNIMGFNVKLYNVIILGISFMLVFTAFQTTGIIEQVVIDSIKYDDSSFQGNGYTSLAIIYLVFAAANWIAPSVVSAIGPKYAMVAGAVTYGLFIASFLKPFTWSLYLTSVLIGIGAACIWTGQGNFLTINSDSETLARNSGIFWAMLQSSLLFGNLFVYFKFQGIDRIDSHLRFTVFIVLLIGCCLGLLLMFALRNISNKASEVADSITEPKASGPLYAFKRAGQLLFTKEMILLSITFFYTGLELSFFSGVYGTCIGFTRQFGNQAKQLMGLNGICIGCGEITGGLTFGLLGKKTNRFGRDPIILLGYLVHILAFYLIFINIPFEASIKDGPTVAYIKSSAAIALLCSFLLGLGDACFNTQIYSILGFIYPEDSAPAFALFKFMQSLAAAFCFFYSTKLMLQWHLMLLVFFGTLGTISFCLVEWITYVTVQRNFRISINESPSKISDGQKC